MCGVSICRVRASAHLGSFCIKGTKGTKNARYRVEPLVWLMGWQIIKWEQICEHSKKIQGRMAVKNLRRNERERVWFILSLSPACREYALLSLLLACITITLTVNDPRLAQPFLTHRCCFVNINNVLSIVSLYLIQCREIYPISFFLN